MKILEVNNVIKRFKDLTAVDNISFSIEEGEIYGLLGPNGAGKEYCNKYYLWSYT